MIIGYPDSAKMPLTVARTPIKEPTDISMFPDMITIDIPIAATAM
jgi:hypothetical protein